MNLTNLLLNLLTGDDSVKALEEKSGASNKQIKMLLLLAIPLLIKYLTKNASSQSGASSLLGALSQHNNTNSFSSQIQNADLNDGGAIINHILGSSTPSAVNGLSSQTGMNEQQVSTVLNSLAPALLSGLSQAASASSAPAAAPAEDPTIHFLGGSAQGQQSGAGLGNLLGMFGGGASQASQAGAPDLLGGLLGGSSPQSAGLGSLLGGSAPSSSIDGTDLLSLLLGGK